MYRTLLLCWTALGLIACGGGGDDDEPPAGGSNPPPTPPTRGTLAQGEPERIAPIPATQLFSSVNFGEHTGLVQELLGDADCDVDLHRLLYHTIDARGQPVVASGALMAPTGNAPNCQGPRPVLLYAHGTQVERDFNIANFVAENNAEGVLIAAVFAAQGYIVVAPNYVGFDVSADAGHAYLNAEQQGNDMRDALLAARSALPTRHAPTLTDNGKLFITGYSQGGYVAMAAHRQLQEEGVPVTAAAPMSGPYALAAFADAVFYGQVVRSAPLFMTYLVTGYQRAYGDVYAAPGELFAARYATGIDTLLPTTGSRSDLFAQGRLPDDQLFSATPPDPAFAPYTPPAAPPEFAVVFNKGFGPDHLVTNEFRLSYLQDAQLHPDGGFPAVTDGRPAAEPANGLRRAFKRNDLRNWTPTAPVLLCGGDEDPTVLFMNTRLMQQYWAAQGAANVTMLDLDSNVSPGDAYAEWKAGFALFKEAIAQDAVEAGATDDGVTAVAEAYHSTLAPPFCLSAVRDFFAAH